MMEISLTYQPDTLALFGRLRALPRPVLLHSAERTSPQARFDIMAADPRHWIRHAGREFRVDGRLEDSGDPLTALRKLLRAEVTQPDRFHHGFIGYFGFGLQHENLAVSGLPPDPTRLPSMQGGIYTWSVISDHLTRRTTLYAHDVGRSYLRDLVHLIEAGGEVESGELLCARFASAPEEAYRAAFDRIQHYLHAGDCYQVNLARHFQAACTATGPGAGWGLYLRLHGLQPGAFSAYIDTPEGEVLSFSPERLLHYRSERIQTCPIKGTAARHPNPVEDARLASALAASAKDRAENLMIVDLLRNDLGRVCVPGSIAVRQLFERVSLRNVHHLVSTIEGRPRPDADAIECLRALFPGGSVTGAPKHRALQIINELEPVGRSLYCGAIGYLDASGGMDLNIAIRTLVLEPERLHCWGGGGIVAESDCDAELREIDLKVGRLLYAVDAAASSMRWSSA
jgi:para-aminobenzoate synthetase component I